MAYRIVSLIAASPVALAQNVVIDAMKHDIRVIKSNDFNKHIGAKRDGQIHVLWFNGQTAADESYLDTFNGVANEFKGIVDFHAVDCDADQKFCADNKVESTPAVMIFPPQSFQQGFLVSDKLLESRDKLAKKVRNMVPDSVTMLTKENIDEWMSSDVSKPKFILFSDKDKPAFMYKAMSADIVMKRTLKFGYTKDDALKEKFAKAIGKKGQGKPTLVSFKGEGGKQQEKYTGKMEFHLMKAWINNFVESGMGDKVQGAGGVQDDTPLEESKPWLVQDIPELTQASHKDVCFKGEGLCVMYLREGKIDGSDETMLKNLQSTHTSQLSGRGTVFKWMWMDMDVESEFKELFDPPALPNIVVFNPHKRLRFTKPDSEDAVTESGINGLIEKILAGDARFKVVPGQKLPKWADRKAAAEGKTEL